MNEVERQAHMERMRDRIRQLFAERKAREYAADLNLDALNDYYGFKLRCSCPATATTDTTQNTGG